MARTAQPGLLIVDRTVHGPYENYQTPEQKIPEKQLDHPWESCLTLANNWGYVPNDQFKSSAKIIHTLIEVVAKGGSLLLGVGPKPDGTFPDSATERLEEIGQWMKVNGSAIYSTRTTPYYNEKNIWFTKSKTGNTQYALVCLEKETPIPATIQWTTNLPVKGTKMKWLQTGESVKWVIAKGVVNVLVPKSLHKSKKSYPALAFSFTGSGM
jgi:alpha-L-fucosidase